MTTRGKQRLVRLAGLIPEPYLAQPERVSLNIAFILLGLVTFLPDRGSTVVAQWPGWLAINWAVLMVVGGAAALHGAWTGYRPSERMGCLATALGCAMFATGLGLVFGWSGVLVSTLFVVLGSGKMVRLLRSLALDASTRLHVERAQDR